MSWEEDMKVESIMQWRKLEEERTWKVANDGMKRKK